MSLALHGDWGLGMVGVRGRNTILAHSIQLVSFVGGADCAKPREGLEQEDGVTRWEVVKCAWLGSLSQN